MIERYEDPDMARIWSNGSKLVWWHQIEVENMRRAAGDELADALARIGPPDYRAVGKHEKRVRHDVMAFLLALDDKIRNLREVDVGEAPVPVDALRQWLHFGLTSSDVADTATHMALVKAKDLLGQWTYDLLGALRAVIMRSALEAKDEITIGRTHGQWAAPMPADHPWRVLFGMLNRAISSTEFSVAVGKMSGPVGTSRRGEVGALSLLMPGVSATSATQLVPRDYIARWATALTDVTDVCEAIATRVWMLAQQGVDEVREGRGAEQVGSSAMPHKRNPIMSEHIRGLCRIARGYRDMLRQGVVQWGEHDLAHSSVERVALPDLCHVAARIITRTHTLLVNLEFVEHTTWDSVREFWFDTHAELQRLQREGMPYVEAHAKLTAGYHGGKIETPAAEEAQA